MSSRNGKAQERWSGVLPDDAGQPRGPEDTLRRAVARLGPFAQRYNADAERFGPWGGPQDRTPLSEELALERVQGLACMYNRLTVAERGAPRVKNILDKLDEIERLSAELARGLHQTDDITRHLLQTGGSGLDNFLGIYRNNFRETACVTELPRPGLASEEAKKSGWIAALESLSQYANFARSTFLQRQGITDPDNADKGGNTNLFKDSYGAPSWQLASQGWHTFELFKPESSSGTDGGPFHVFLLDVLEYATGVEPEAHKGILPWVKRAVKVHRKATQLSKREHELINEQTAVDAPDSRLTLKERNERHSEIEQKFIALKREQYDLWPELYPFAKTSDRAR